MVSKNKHLIRWAGLPVSTIPPCNVSVINIPIFQMSKWGPRECWTCSVLHSQQEAEPACLNWLSTAGSEARMPGHRFIRHLQHKFNHSIQPTSDSPHPRTLPLAF